MRRPERRPERAPELERTTWLERRSLDGAQRDAGREPESGSERQRLDRPGRDRRSKLELTRRTHAPRRIHR